MFAKYFQDEHLFFPPRNSVNNFLQLLQRVYDSKTIKNHREEPLMSSFPTPGCTSGLFEELGEKTRPFPDSTPGPIESEFLTTGFEKFSLGDSDALNQTSV